METVGYIPEEEKQSTKPTKPTKPKPPKAQSPTELTTPDNPTEGADFDDGGDATPKQDGDEAGKE